jgi:hypothetical protein
MLDEFAIPSDAFILVDSNPVCSHGCTDHFVSSLGHNCLRLLQRHLRREVAGEVEDELRGVGGEGVNASVGGGHDGHVGSDGSVAGVQGGDVWLSTSLGPERQVV